MQAKIIDPSILRHVKNNTGIVALELIRQGYCAWENLSLDGVRLKDWARIVILV